MTSEHLKSISKRRIKTDINLVEQILEQGQRLRSAMVQTILNNDPFNVDVMKSRNLKSCSAPDTLKDVYAFNTIEESENKQFSLEDKHKLLAYLRGESVTRNDERKILHTFKTMSNVDICDITERSYNSDFTCHCDTCKAYYKHNLDCDFNCPSTTLCKDRYNAVLQLNKVPHNVPDIQSDLCTDMPYLECIKYVDSLKVSIHSLLLNQEGNKKVYGSSIDKNLKLPTSISHTYFIEYHIPEEIIKFVLRTKSKVDSGLYSRNTVRMCSKKLCDEAIYFKQISFTDIGKLNEVDLSSINIKFKISCRVLNQKRSNILGFAQFNMASFLYTKYFSLNQDLPVILNGDSPIVVGKLRVLLELGCGQLYFGREFIDGIYANKENITNNSSENNIHLDREHVNTEASIVPQELEFSDKTFDIVNKTKLNTKRSNTNEIESTRKVQEIEKEMINLEIINKDTSPKIKSTVQINNNPNKEVLFGFICIKEAEFLDVKDITYVVCYPFCEDDSLYSRLVHSSANPDYNFNQTLPFVYDDTFLNKLRDNFMIFEFWEKIDGADNLIGVCKISLHQFYIAFRNPVITKYLNRNRLPVICCDGWEPICNPLNGQIHGQVQILVALGADTQVHNLKVERGFHKELVIAKPSSNVFKEIKRTNKVLKRNDEDLTTLEKQESIVKNKFRHIQKSPQKRQNKKVNTKNIAVQSDTVMSDQLNNSKPNCNTNALTAFLDKLVQQNHKRFVENSTNTEIPQQNVNVVTDVNNLNNAKVRKTSDLLDSLQQALSINTSPSVNVLNRRSEVFKAHVVIENALHLPSRKKCRAKVIKGKTCREELLPNAYVSFETDSDLKITQIVRDCKNPEWDYRCDVDLPADLLTNNQKRLIFKVWKKIGTLSHTEPNAETDRIIGFAALDLTVLLAGMPNVSGWFNIMDFSNKCNGQIKISVTPLENLSKFNRNKRSSTSILTNSPVNFNIVNTELQIDKTEEPGELLSRALKRKFSELDEITERLKLRLSSVTKEESDGSNDGFAEEFENDINTLCVEDDYDMINFEDNTPQSETQEASGALLQIQNTNFIYRDDELLETTLVNCEESSLNDQRENLAQTSNISSMGIASVLDKQLMAGRQKIDSLLEKLSLLSHNENEIFGNRYVSGCSTKEDCSNSTSDDILTDIRKDHISTDVSADNSLTNIQIPHKYDTLSSSSNSNSGLLTQYTENRLVPDGAGNSLLEKLKM